MTVRKFYGFKPVRFLSPQRIALREDASADRNRTVLSHDAPDPGLAWD